MNKDLYIFNSLTSQKELFKSTVPNQVSLYVCGPTVYSSSHMGHARSAIVFDCIVRFLKFIGLKTKYVRNFTDIDDKIITRANEEGKKPEEISEKYKLEYIEDMKSLGCNDPDYQPSVSENIPEIINLIKNIIDKEYGYESNGDVYFNVQKFKPYGKLSNQSIDSILSNTRLEINPNKSYELDFALWKKAKAGEPFWESPWGNGRPGWHIECSSMSRKYLGDTFDIHGGGRDLIFPHHENEIAQSECVSNKKFANYWIHNGFLTVEGNKMAKSDGNFITVNELKDRYHGEVIRLAMLMTHYRQPLNWTENSLLESKKILNKWFSFFSDIEISKEDEEIVDEHILSALKDDINTPKAISELHQLFKNCSKEDSLSIQKFLNSARLLGLMLCSPKKWMEWNIRENNFDEIKINELIEKRNLLRDQGNYNDADKIRSQLDELGIILEDKGGKTSWKQKTK